MGRLKQDAITAEEERRRPATLGEIADLGHDIFCWCNRCGHNSEVSTKMLLGRLGPATPVPEIGARMACTSCGSKDVATRPAWPSLGQVAGHG